MDYAKHYNALIERARHRELTGYVERHHVIPRSLGGGNNKANIVRLTPEEHYVAHLLLVKMHPGDHRLLWAAMNMTGANRRMPGRRNKLYGWLRRRFGEEMARRNKGRVVSEETRAKLRAAHLGKKHGPRSSETKSKMSSAAKGRPKSEAHRAALAAAKIGNTNALGHKKSAESIEKTASKLRGHESYGHSDYRAKQRENMLRIWAERRSKT